MNFPHSHRSEASPGALPAPIRREVEPQLAQGSALGLQRSIPEYLNVCSGIAGLGFSVIPCLQESNKFFLIKAVSPVWL
jgi:hypothetical protein